MGYSIVVGLNKGDNEAVKAIASVVIDNSIKVRNIAIREGKHGEFIAMPRFKSQDKEGNLKYTEVCHPITKEFREDLYGNIMKTYEEAKNSEKRMATYSSPDIKEEPKVGITAKAVYKEGTALKGFANVVLNDNFVINNIPIRENSKTKDLFMSMPSYKSTARNNDYMDVVYPTSKEFSAKLNEKVVGALNAALEKGDILNSVENPFENGTFDNCSIKEMAGNEQKDVQKTYSVDKNSMQKAADTKKMTEPKAPEVSGQKKDLGQDR